ncbi:MAG: hypothetical protein ACLFVU_01420 [Phycisphaerae bacterium]
MSQWQQNQDQWNQQPAPQQQWEQPGVQNYDQQQMYRLPKKPAWPKVFGILSIVFAGLGILSTLFGLIVGNPNSASNPSAPNVPTREDLTDAMPVWHGGAETILSVLLPVLLLIAGIMLLKYKPLGRTLHLVWAGIVVVWTIINVILFAGLDLSAYDSRYVPIMKAAMIGVSLVGLIYPGVVFFFMIREKTKLQLLEAQKMQ